MDRPCRPCRRLLTAVGSIVLLLAAALVAGAPPASAQLYGPIPANAAGEPTDAFTDQDSIWAYVRSDLAGGRICIVPADTTVETGTCDGALGGANHLVGIGTLFTLISGHGLPAGTYRLMVENSVEEPTEVGDVFTVTACPDCPPNPDAAAVEAFKSAARAMSGDDGNMTRMCQLTGVLEVVGGKAIRARAVVEPPASTGPLTADSPSFVMTLVGGTAFAMWNPAAANIQKGLDIAQALACGAEQMYADQAADPPDPDFGTVAQPVLREFERLGPAELDAVSASLDRQRALGVAMLHGYERFQGAQQAGDVDAQVRQLRAAGGFAGEQARELATSAAALRAWADVAAADEELGAVMMTAAEKQELVAAYARVRTDGFSDAELAELRGLGYTDAQVAVIRSRFTPDIAAVPADTTYADALRQAADGMEQQVQAYTDMGLELLVVASRIEAANTNHPPTADDLAVAASTGRAVIVQLTGSDPDGDPITFDVVRQPEHGALSGSGASRTYTSVDGFTGTDTFTYTARDEGGATSAPATVTIAVEPRTNNAPTATSFAVNARQAEPVTLELLASDPDGDPLTYDVVPPLHGRLSGTAPNLTYTSDVDFTGTDELRFTASDGLLESAQATVWIQVSPDLVARDDVLKADPAGVADVLQNDAATKPLRVVSATNGEHGTVTCGELGGCTYRAVEGFTGVDGFDYTVRDEAGRTATGHVQVEVASPPAASGNGPVVRDDRAATLTGRAVDVAVLANDAGRSALQVSASTTPSHGQVDCTTGGTCRYTPTSGFTGYDGFGYTVTDAEGATARATVDITVAPAGARLDVRMTGRPASADGPADQEIVQGESARWGASVVPSPALSQDEVAALSPPTGTLQVTGPHATVPGTLTHAPGWSVGPTGGTVPLTASESAVLGDRITRPIPRPLPPISQGTGGDGHVPILVGSKVYAFFHHSSPTSVTCVDRATGLLCPGYPRPVWQMGTTDVNGPGVVVDGRIYTHLVPATGGQETHPVALFCWDTRTASTCGLEVLDRSRNVDRSVASAPVLVGDRVYLGAQTGRVYCFDPVAGKACATPAAPTGLAEASGNAMDIVSHGNRVFLASRDGTTACLTVPSLDRCAGWAAPRSLGGWNLVNQHDAQGATNGVCVVGAGTARCVTDAGVESTHEGFPVNDDYYGNTQEGETGRRTFIPSLGRGGLGCWDWSTSSACAGASFDEGGWVTYDVAGQPLPSAYGTTWDGSCLVALGDPGRVFTMDAEGNSPCTSLSTGTSSLAMDLRDQRCDGGVGGAAWRAVELLESDPAGAELTSVRVRVVDATSGEELLTGDLVGGTGRLSLAAVDPVRHPSLRVEAIAVARTGDGAWADDVPPRVALAWDPDPLQVCLGTTTTVDCSQPDLAAVLVRAALTGSAATDEASLTVRRSPSCTPPPPAPTPTPTPAPTPPPAPAPTPPAPTPAAPGNPDRDGDGLLNTVEAGLGTDPDDPDTDDDRLGDGLEVTGTRIRERFEVCGAKVRRSVTVTTDPLRADTDRDGLGDGLEVKGYVIKQRVVISNAGDSYVIGRTRTDPTRADTDRDRLTDKQERTGSANKRYDRHKTDPSKCDTDHGALSDGIEVNHRSDPADFRSGPGDPGTIPMGRRPMLLRRSF